LITAALGDPREINDCYRFFNRERPVLVRPPTGNHLGCEGVSLAVDGKRRCPHTGLRVRWPEQVGHRVEQVAALERLCQYACGPKCDGGVRVHPLPGVEQS
jgi:hypothetical protein